MAYIPIDTDRFTDRDDYSIQYLGTYYTELRHRNVPVCESISIYGYICHISSTPMPESLWLSGKSV